MINLTSESETYPPEASTGRLPENLDVPQSKEGKNKKDALHTSQRSQDKALKEKNLKKGTDQSNPNVTNYLGSEKLNEKLSDNTQKYSHHKEEAEEILMDEKFLKEFEKSKTEPKRHEGTADGDGGSIERDDSKAAIRYDF